MIKPNIPYLAFDDRLLMLFGIPLLTMIIPFVFFGFNWETYWPSAHQEYPESLVYTTVFWLFNRQLMIVLRKKYNAFSDTLKRFGIQLLVIAVAVPFFSITLGILLNQIFQMLGTTDLRQPTLLQALSSTYVLTFALVMLYDTIFFFHKYKEAIQEKDRIQMAHVQGQLDNLRNQINPHFLFNSLNTLMNLIPTDPTRAMSYLDKLSRFYRYTVSNQEQQLVPLQTELENIRIYADLLKERFHDGIQISLPEAAVGKAQILPLCLQLLIENAVKHNVVSTKKPLHVAVELANDGKAIRVKNNIQPKIREADSTGMGLKNIRTRLAFFTPEPLEVKEAEGEFTVVVPLVF
ncbi:MAG: histidine kinase [Lewinellaceae bacterium]|nr:histidine kinase [Saprospiraceae bacterium]MCB9336879.1 histidine kinase [Lewinellaceae bacterium]